MKLFPNNILYPESFTIHRVGNVYCNEDNNYAMLSQIYCGELCLIVLDLCCNRWCQPVLVKDVNDITINEWQAISDNKQWKYLGRIKSCNHYNRGFSTYKIKSFLDVVLE